MRQLFALVTLFSLFSFSTNLHAQDEISGRVKMSNPSREINDGKVKVIVENGEAPYTYYWPQPGTPTTSDSTTGVAEGTAGKVIVVDAKLDTFVTDYFIPTESLSESINAFVKPGVDIMGMVLFYDPFSAIGIYDPVLRDKAGNPLMNANGTVQEKGVPLVVVWLLFGGVFFTLRMKFLNFRAVKHAIDLVRGKFDSPDDPGEVTHFQALTTALSATVGLGNIAGVAVAVSIGGAGATFWMIVAGLLGMTLKFAECTLGVKYREIDANGQVYGGPMHYLSTALAKRGKGWGALGKVLAVVFSIMCIGGSFGGGNMFQSNQAFAQVSQDLTFLQGYGAWFGVGMAALVGLVILGGIKSIAKVTDKIVPFMVSIYVIVALIIIIMNIGKIDIAFAAILDGAFSPEAMKGGIIGVFIVGFQRAAFSNEAGMGSSSIAHSAAKTNEPVSEGIVALLEPFVDTVLVCTMTALVIIFTGYHENVPGDMSGTQITTAAFSQYFGWFRYVLSVAIVLFAFSTMISWSYYGLKAWAFIFGHGKAADYTYKGLFLICTVIGAATGLGAVLDFSDMMILGMGFPNLVGLLILSNEIAKDTKSYFARLKSGEIKQYK